MARWSCGLPSPQQNVRWLPCRLRTETAAALPACGACAPCCSVTIECDWLTVSKGREQDAKKSPRGFARTRQRVRNVASEFGHEIAQPSRQPQTLHLYCGSSTTLCGSCDASDSIRVAEARCPGSIGSFRCRKWWKQGSIFAGVQPAPPRRMTVLLRATAHEAEWPPGNAAHRRCSCPSSTAARRRDAGKAPFVPVTGMQDDAQSLTPPAQPGRAPRRSQRRCRCPASAATPPGRAAAPADCLRLCPL